MGRFSIFKSLAIASLGLTTLTGTANAQRDDARDRSITNELNRERAETRIERLKQDQRQTREERSERNSSRAQKVPQSGNPPPQR